MEKCLDKEIVDKIYIFEKIVFNPIGTAAGFVDISKLLTLDSKTREAFLNFSTFTLRIQFSISGMVMGRRIDIQDGEDDEADGEDNEDSESDNDKNHEEDNEDSESDNDEDDDAVEEEDNAPKSLA